MDILTIKPSLIDEFLNVSCTEKTEKNERNVTTDIIIIIIIIIFKVTYSYAITWKILVFGF